MLLVSPRPNDLRKSTSRSHCSVYQRQGPKHTLNMMSLSASGSLVAARLAPMPARRRATPWPRTAGVGQRSLLRTPPAALEPASRHAPGHEPSCCPDSCSAGAGARATRPRPRMPVAASALPAAAPPVGTPAQQAEPARAPAAPFSWEAQWCAAATAERPGCSVPPYLPAAPRAQSTTQSGCPFAAALPAPGGGAPLTPNRSRALELAGGP